MTGDPFLVTKLTRPALRRQLVRRSRLDERLDHGRDCRLTLIDAPAGWGKTTAAAEWLGRRHPGSTAWLSLDADDDDPRRFWPYLVEALRTVAPDVGAEALQLLTVPQRAATAAALPSLVNELARIGAEIVLVLDDYHLITDADIHAGMAFLVERLPANVRAVIVTRSDPPFPLGRWRARGELNEVRVDELRFGRDDAGALLRQVGFDLSDDAVTQLHGRTEGWAAGLYLAALSLERHPDPEAFVAEFAGDDRHVLEYLGGEVLDGLDAELRDFLIETSVLSRLCGSLCDAVTGRSDSSELLVAIQRANHFIVPLDGRHHWYRYHHLFRELLRVELDRRGFPVGQLHQRAAAWLAGNGDAAEAIRHLCRAGDLEPAAELLVEHWVGYLQRGDLTAIDSSLDAVGDRTVRRDPRLCLIRAWMTINVGRVAELGDWIDAAEAAAADWPGRDALSFRAAAAMLRCIEAYLGGDAGAAIAVARQAIALDAEERPPWRSVGCPVLGIALFWSGRPDESTATLSGAIPRAEQAGNHLAVMHALGCLALAAADRGDELGALRLAEQAFAVRDAHGFAEHWASAMAHLAQGRALAARGDDRAAEAAVAQAVELSRYGLARIELAFGLLAWADLRLRRNDRQRAAALVDEAGAALRACADAGVVDGMARQLAEQLDRRATRARVAGSGQELSERELAILALLPTELTLREVATTLFVSMNTVKTHTRSIYRKLGASTRAEAIGRAEELGLV